MLQLVIAILAIAIFFLLILFDKDTPNRKYIKFVLLFYPVQAIDVAPSVVSTSLFVFVSSIFGLFFYRRVLFVFTGSRMYKWMTYTLLIIIVAGLFSAFDLSLDSASYLMEILSILFFSRVLIMETIGDKLYIDKVVKYFKVSLLLSLLFLFAQLVFGPEVTIAKSQNINVTGGLSIRYPSFFQDPQKYAQFLAAVTFFFLIPDANAPFSRPLNYLFVLMSLLALFLTGGRSATGGWVLGMFILFLFSRSAFRFTGVILALFTVAIVYNYAGYFALFQRTSTVEDAYDFRFEIWKDAWKIFLEHPLFGIGIGNYANYVSLHNPDQYWIVDNDITYYDHPESGYLKMLTEYGVIGFTLHMALIMVPYFISISNFISTRQLRILLPVAALSSWFVAFYTVYSLGDVRIYILVASITSLMIAYNANFASDHQYNTN